MISLDALLVFVAAAGIVVAFALVARHFLTKAAEHESSEDGEPPSHH